MDPTALPPTIATALGAHAAGPLADQPWIGLALFALLTLWPVMRIFARAGFDPRWGLVQLIPGFGMLASIALLTHRRWPGTRPLPKRRNRRAAYAQQRAAAKQEA